MPSIENAIANADCPQVLDAPAVPVILKDEEGNESIDGLLPRSALSQDLVVVVPDWAAPFVNTIPFIVIISWVPEGGDFTEVFRDSFEDAGEQYLIVPSDKLANGIYALSYKVSYGGNELCSKPKRVTVDRVPPEDGQEPVRLDMVDVSGDITDDYLKQHGEVRFRVARYVDAKARDRAIYYWTDNPNPPDSETEIREQMFTQKDIDDDRLIITIYELDIRSRGPGQRYVYYRLRDWAGNRGPRSTLLPVFVDLSPAPGNLKPPRVPLSARGLIDRQHARDGATDQRAVTVEIDEFDNPGGTDRVVIQWNGNNLAPLDVDPANFPLTARVPWLTLTANGLGPMDVRVSYRVIRGGTSTPPSPETRVPVNLTVAGQDHRNAPALLNTTLARLDIFGAESKQLNTLLAVDYGHPAVAHLALYDSPQPGQKLYLYWGSINTPVAEYEVQAGDIAGTSIMFSISWDVIDKDKENPRLFTFYTTSNGVNLQQAEATPVNVAIVVISNLPEPIFPHAGKQGVLHCCSQPRLWEGVWVHIKGNAAFDDGDVVELEWQGCYGENGTSPIQGVTDTFKVTLSEEQARDGFDVHVGDYEKLIAPMVNNGSALCQYYLSKSNGGVGFSRPDFVIINRTMASGQVCGPGNDLCEESQEVSSSRLAVKT